MVNPAWQPLSLNFVPHHIMSDISLMTPEVSPNVVAKTHEERLFSGFVVAIPMALHGHVEVDRDGGK